MATISSVKARQILDSRGVPTVAVTVTLDTGHVTTSSAPGGSSTGKYEAVELRDGDEAVYFGKGVLTAVGNVNTLIAPQLVGMDPTNQAQIDQAMIALDGTPNKSKFGANAVLPVSQAICKAGALASNLHLFDYLAQKYQLRGSTTKLPTPQFNMINGGKHGAGNLDFQEFMIVPVSTKPYPEAIRMGAEIYHSLEKALIQMNAIHSVGTEGGYAPNLFTNKDALEIVVEAIRRTDYAFGRDVFLALDVAAAHFFEEERYNIKDRPKPIMADELVEFYKELNENINIFSLEDPFVEDDWKSWNAITAALSQNTIIVGDDFLAGNKERLQKAIAEKACTAILVKPNQIGTVTEIVEMVSMAKQAGWEVIVSHRSGETNDTFIADFAVGVGANYTKFGAPSRGERTCKYNRLSEIYEMLNPAS